MNLHSICFHCCFTYLKYVKRLLGTILLPFLLLRHRLSKWNLWLTNGTKIILVHQVTTGTIQGLIKSSTRLLFRKVTWDWSKKDWAKTEKDLNQDQDYNRNQMCWSRTRVPLESAAPVVPTGRPASAKVYTHYNLFFSGVSLIFSHLFDWKCWEKRRYHELFTESTLTVAQTHVFVQMCKYENLLLQSLLNCKEKKKFSKFTLIWTFVYFLSCGTPCTVFIFSKRWTP